MDPVFKSSMEEEAKTAAKIVDPLAPLETCRKRFAWIVPNEGRIRSAFCHEAGSRGLAPETTVLRKHAISQSHQENEKKVQPTLSSVESSAARIATTARSRCHRKSPSRFSSSATPPLVPFFLFAPFCFAPFLFIHLHSSSTSAVSSIPRAQAPRHRTTVLPYPHMDCPKLLGPDVVFHSGSRQDGICGTSMWDSIQAKSRPKRRLWDRPRFTHDGQHKRL